MTVVRSTALRRGRRTLCLGALLATLACAEGPTGPNGNDRIVGGIDLDVLFAPPTPAEVGAVEADWAARSPEAVDVEVERDTVVEAAGIDVRVRVVGHAVDGLRHYGAVLNADGLTGPAPVIVYTHGGDAGARLEDFLFLLAFLGDDVSRYVWVVPSFRSEPLGFDGREWVSEGPASPWDRDVDDALALLDVALEVEPAADPDRVGVLGLSRGAGVGLLMGIRDERIDRVVDYFGPTDFFDVFVQDVIEEALRGSARDLPGLDVLDERFVQPLRRGELSVGEFRSELVRRSAVLFAERLPAVQLHHGTADPVVEVSQARSLIEAMIALGRVSPAFEGFVYEGGRHDPISLPGSITATIDFLSALLEPSAKF